MKSFLKLFLILMVIAPLVACQQQKSKKRSEIRRGGRGAPAVQPGAPNVTLPQLGQATPGQVGAHPTGMPFGAIVSGDGLDDVTFDRYIHDFVSATMPRHELGTVSGQMNQSTGVRFWARIAPATGAFNPNGMNATINQADSELRIVIWDTYAGTYDATNELIPEYPVHVKGTAQGQITGNRFDIYFSQTYKSVNNTQETGWFRFQGDFTNQWVKGRVWYANGGSTGFNDMGNIVIPTCSFFKCN